MLSVGLWSPPIAAAAAPPPAGNHRAALGPLAESAISAAVQGQHLPATLLQGRPSKQGTAYGVFLRGTTSAKAIASTGAVPGTVLSVGATADATLPQLTLLAALPGITQVELAGRAQKELDQSVPAIHASEPGHASAPSVPHLWAGTGGDTETAPGGGSTVWTANTQIGAVVPDCYGNGGEAPTVYGGDVYQNGTDTGGGLITLNASTGAEVGHGTNGDQPAFDGTTMFYVLDDTLTAQSLSGTVLWTWTFSARTDLTEPIVVNHNVFVASENFVFALPAAGNGTSTNAPTWTGDAGATASIRFLTAGDGLVLGAGGSQLTAFADSTYTPSSDPATTTNIDAAHDGDQPNDSLTSPLAASPKWTDHLGADMSTPLIANGMVFVDTNSGSGNGDSEMFALNQATGAVVWGPVNIGGTEDYGYDDFGITYDNGRLFAVNSNGLVQGFTASMGKPLWALQLPRTDGYPVAFDGIVYVGGAGGNGSIIGQALAAIGESSGTLLWSVPLAGFASEPAVTSAGVYFSSSCATSDITLGSVTQATSPSFSGDTGAGSIVGIVDTGIDLTNPDFQTSQGTRILDLWDQPACPQPVAGLPGSWTCPAQPANAGGYTYGAECSQSMIDTGTCGTQETSQCCGIFFFYGATCENPITGNTTPNDFPEEDCDGHGTHVAGIAAGNGRAAPGGTYIGVAPQADLVVVKSDGSLSDVIDGVDYIFKVAAARGEPASVNISLGTNEGPHDGTDMFETMLDALTGPGHLVSVAGGNEATNNPTYHYHASATVADGQVHTDGLLVELLPVFLDIWYPGTASMSAAITEAGNGATPWVSPDSTGVSGEDGTCTQNIPGQDEFEDPVGNVIEILSCTHMPSNGMNEIQLALFNPGNYANGDGLLTSTGVNCSEAAPCLDNFELLLRGNSAAGATYNAWTFDQGDYLFYRGDGNDRSTLDEPASAHDVISVGSDVTRNTWPSEAGTELDTSTVGGISDFSGEGPTLDGRTGIDIVAPGEEIGSSLSSAASPDLTSACPAGTTAGCTSPDGNHMFLQGTSMAAPHVAGALALLLAQVPTIDVVQAKSLLAQSANESPLTSGGAATTWGVGKLEVGPGVLSLTPSEGSIAGGNTININGVDLKAGVTMSLGGQPLTLTNVGTNEWSASVPASTQPGPVTLTITNADGSTAVDPSAYFYIDPTAYHALTPARVCDTRATSPANQCTRKTLGARRTVTVQVTGGVVPAGARAVVVNLTAINHTNGATYVTAYPAGFAVPPTSNINLDTSGAATNLAIVQLSTGGAITIYNSVGSVDVIVDVEGYFASPTGSGTVPGEFHSIPPLRICDTRAKQNTECAGATNDPLAGGTWRDVVLSGLPPGASGGTPSIPADGTAAAAVFNLTATQGTAATFLAVAPPNSSDQCPSRPVASNVNPSAGVTLPNRVISSLGPRHDVCVFNSVGSVDFIIDVDGWFGNGSETATGALFNSIAPARICDTRSGSHTECAGMALATNVAHAIAVAGVSNVPSMGSGPPLAVVVNVTAVNGTAPTYFTLYPSNVSSRPRASDLNPVAGEVVANLSIVGIAQAGGLSGDVSLYNAAGSINAILDVAGWFQ